MNPFVISLEAVKPAAMAQVGGKARALARLAQAGFPVPSGLVILPAAFEDEGITAAAWVQLQARLGERRAEQPDITWAVRSSGLDEDSAGAAFAGEFATVLNVGEDTAVRRAVNTVYASRHQAAAYRQARGLDGPQAMAVLVQPLVPAACSGVCFSLDPVAPEGRLMVINAAWGLGPGVADGVAPADTYWLRRRDLTLEKQRIAVKTRQIVPDSTGGLKETAVPPDQHHLPCLPEAWLTRIAQFALALEQFFGYPQDVEWAIADGQIWLLQSRPITTLPATAVLPPFAITWEEADDQHRLWTLEWYSRGETPLLPLEIDYRVISEESREETCRFLGAERNQTVRFWNGRAYARPIPVGLTDADLRLRRAVQADLQARLQTQGWTAWDYWGPEVEQAVARLRAFDRVTADGPPLAAHLENSLAVLRRNFFIHPCVWSKPRQPYFDAFAAVTGLAGDEAETAAYHLLDGEENMFTRLVDGLYELAVLARASPAVVALIADPSQNALTQLADLPEAADFCRRLEAFLAIYGERTGEGYGSEMTILTLTWYEEPARLLQLVALYLDPQREAPAFIRARTRQARDEQVEAYCKRCEDATAVAEFRRQLAYARRSLAVLEDHNHWIEQASSGQLRLAIVAAAGRLVSQGLLSQVDDVFWLTFAEILAALRGESAVSLPALIAERQGQHAEWARLEPPPVLGLPDAKLPSRPPIPGFDFSVPATKVTTTNEVEEDGRLHGIGASAGQAQGRARVVPYGAPQPPLEPGDILVATNAGPLWTPFFPILGGLVLEEGSLGQHAAVTAREYGIPAVVGCRDATRRIANGSRIGLDGQTGAVWEG